MCREIINRLYRVLALALVSVIIPWTALAQSIDLEPNLASAPKLLAIQQDAVTQFLATGEGVRVGTMRGTFSGVVTQNFQFLAVPPPDFKADDLILLVDNDGDQMLFRAQVTGRFLSFLTGPTPDPAGNPNRKKLVEFGGPFTGIYEVIQGTGKFQGYIGRKFPCKGLGITPAKNQAIGFGYTEIYDDKSQ
jgi:hypothetical protein